MKVSAEEREVSDRVEQDEADRWRSQKTGSASSCVGRVWAGGVRGAGRLRYGGRSLSVGEESEAVWSHGGGAAWIGAGTSIDGMGMSEANNAAGKALLRAVKLSMSIRGRRERIVEWWGGGGSWTSSNV